MQNAITWFEIPVADLGRAVTFYNTIFGFELHVMDTGPGWGGALFPSDGGVGGSLTRAEGYVPSAEGALVYLYGGDDLSVVLNRVDAAGGRVVMPQTSIGENGWISTFIDSEGNRVGLHSPHSPRAGQ